MATPIQTFLFITFTYIPVEAETNPIAAPPLKMTRVTTDAVAGFSKATIRKPRAVRIIDQGFLLILKMNGFFFLGLVS